MKLSYALLTFIASSILLSGCENQELKKCIDQQSYLWNSSSKDPNANKAYWAAVERCKAKYD
ncbi:hypothetical protein [Thiomicrorhabdus cannonii]|uniref:hypothetical protein n=1 Tax=Thiomicrorhabdus cannonii TaxID=2748011 RepID=UPI0015B95E3D|nr:hypothetical protein [Thiomicrorhabdus cannonii]